MIQPADLPLFCSIGAYFDQQIQLVSNATGLPIPLNDALVEMAVYSTSMGGDTIISLDSDGNSITITPSEGIIRIEIASNVTAEFPTSGLQQQTVFFGDQCTCEGLELTGLTAFYSMWITQGGKRIQYVYNSVFLLLPE